MPLNCVACSCHNHTQKENKLGFSRFPNNDPEFFCKREKQNSKPRNPSGKNVYICGVCFVTGTFLLQKQ